MQQFFGVVVHHNRQSAFVPWHTRDILLEQHVKVAPFPIKRVSRLFETRSQNKPHFFSNECLISALHFIQ